MNQLSLHQPHAIIMVGIPGSGKTQFAEKFAQTFSAPRLDLQFLSRHAASPEAAGELARGILAELLKTKQSVVLELSTETRAGRTEVAKIVRRAGYVPLFVWTQIDQQTAKKRSQRNGVRAEEFDSQLRHFSAPHAREQAVVISGKHTYATQARVVLKKLSAPRAEDATRQLTPPRRNRIGVL